MKDLKKFTIPFVGLKQGNHLFEYQIDNTFFEAFGFDEFHSSKIQVNLDFLKKSTFFELTFDIKGVINVDCDLSLEPYDQEITCDFKLIVRFGPEYNDENEDILILPHEAYELDVSQYVYETIVLAIPQKKIHPKVKDGSMDSEALKKLNELKIKEDTTENVDPRWDKLKDLLTEKNT